MMANQTDRLLVDLKIKPPIGGSKSLGLIYETNVRPKFERTVVSTQNLEFININL